MGVLWTLALNGTLGVASYLVARFGLRQPRGLARTLAAAVLGWTWQTFGMEVLGAFGGLGRGPLLGWVLAGLLVGLACRALGREHEATLDTRSEWTWDEVLALSLSLWASARIGATSLLFPVKVVSDGPIYHLYFAARWWKARNLEMIAAPFGENAATYFPAVGDLWFTWLMIGWDGDRLSRIGQTPFLVLAGLTAFAMARRLGAGVGASAIATAWFVTSQPLLLFSFVPNVDTIFVAGDLLAAYFFLRHALGDAGRGHLALGALAAGAALGTKATGVVFVPPLLLLGLLSALCRGRTVREKAGGAITVLAFPLVPAGFWFARNTWLTGNPLYPLHLEAFGRVVLPGWYGPEVMRLSVYYLGVHEWRALVDILLAVLDPRLAPAWLAAVAGLWAVGARERSGLDRWVWFASGLAVVNVALYWLVIPYRTQQRFMLQALGLAVVPLARSLDRASWGRWVGVGLLVTHLCTPPAWPFAEKTPPWDLSRLVPNELTPLIVIPHSRSTLRPIETDVQAQIQLAWTIGLGLAALATAWSLARALGTASARNHVIAGLAAAVFAGGTIAVSYPSGADPRWLFFPPFREYVRGWLELDQRSGPSGTRVAYAGNNLPYYLLGVGLRNEVRYVNIDGHRAWLLHDYHRDARRSGMGTWPHPRPGWDRIHPDYPSWLANLRAAGIRLLVVTRAVPDEGPHNVADETGFPIERRWADEHPETFELLYGPAQGDPEFRLYRVKPETPSG